MIYTHTHTHIYIHIVLLQCRPELMHTVRQRVIDTMPRYAPSNLTLDELCMLAMYTEVRVRVRVRVRCLPCTRRYIDMDVRCGCNWDHLFCFYISACVVHVLALLMPVKQVKLHIPNTHHHHYALPPCAYITKKNTKRTIPIP